MSIAFHPVAVGHRLLLLREAKGVKKQKDWAAILKASPSRYSNWENGIQMIPVKDASAVCSRTGATLDYIYHGKAETLPVALSLAIDKIEEELAKVDKS